MWDSIAFCRPQAAEKSILSRDNLASYNNYKSYAEGCRGFNSHKHASSGSKRGSPEANGEPVWMDAQ
jgi:hypothetical protein